MLILDVDKTKEDLVLHWFYNINNDITNKDILLINFKSKSVYNEFIKSNYFKKNNNLLITSLQKLTIKDLNNMGKKSIILVENKEVSFGHLEVLKDENIKILFCGISNFDEVKNYIKPSNFSSQKPRILSQYLYHFYLQNLDPLDIIYNISYAKYFISSFLDYERNNDLSFNQQSIKLFLFRNIQTITIDTMLNDIKYLEHSSILTSRLAIFLFKICTFYCNATDKEIGTYYASKLKIRSRVYNNKRFNISNTKGYYIKNMQQRTENNVKINIASYLLNKNACDINILSQATGLSLSALEDLIER